MYVRYGQLSAPGVAEEARRTRSRCGSEQVICAFVSREIYWVSTAAVHIMPVPLRWRRGGAAATAKPRGTLSVSLCFMDVSNCARLRPFRLSGPCGGVCAKQLGNPADNLLPRSSRACVLTDVQMNGRSESQKNKRTPQGFQPRSQTSQCERKGRAASVPGIKLNFYASPLRHLW